jgi:hypothetical protein
MAAFVASFIPLVHQMSRNGVLATLQTLDRRWIFLMMFW